MGDSSAAGNSNSHGDDEAAATNLVALGALISRRRRALKLSINELAKIVDVTSADIRALEAGTWDVDMLLLLEIAQVLRQRLSDDLNKPPFC